jgi:hypothetical protein
MPRISAGRKQQHFVQYYFHYGVSATDAVMQWHIETILRLQREGKALKIDADNLRPTLDMYDKLPPRLDGVQQEGENAGHSVR